jgi:Phage ABA sandwich domain
MESLKAGRPLDALVAEKVLAEKYEFLEFVGDYCRPDPEDSVAYDCCPRYSTDIAAAWQIVEKLIAITPQQDLHIEHWYHEEDETSGWQISSCYELGEWKDWVQAETLPLAICLAALKASRAQAI